MQPHPGTQESAAVESDDLGMTVVTADWADEARLNALRKLLRRVREAFGMDVVFVSQFLQGRRVFRHVEASEADTDWLKIGQSDPLEESYCQRVVDGRLPQAIPDARTFPATAAMPVTHEADIGAHLSVPIRLDDGRVFGTLCCFSHQAHPSLNSADAVALSELAGIVAKTLVARKKAV